MRGVSAFLHTFRISIALAIRSLEGISIALAIRSLEGISIALAIRSLEGISVITPKN